MPSMGRSHYSQQSIFFMSILSSLSNLYQAVTEAAGITINYLHKMTADEFYP
jgi:uncharacterized membrane protein